MVRADLLVLNASEVITLRGPPRPRRGRELADIGRIERGALAVRDGRIIDVAPSRELRQRHRGARVFDAAGRSIVPGFVDAHTHLPFAGSRAFELELKLAGKGYLDILAAGGGIHRTVSDTRAATSRDLVRTIRARLATMLAWGTTTAEAKSGYGLNLEDELKQLRALKAAARGRHVELVATFLGAHVVPKEMESHREDYLRLLIDEMLPRVAREKLAEFCDIFLEAQAFHPDECRRILKAARSLGLRTKIHADEFTNQKGAELAAELECTSAEHLLKISDRGIRALAQSGTMAVLLPGVSITSLLDEFAPARKLVDAGAAIALGTDFNPNCHVLTMPPVIQWASYFLRLSPAEALSAATVNSAHAVGRGDRVGSLEVGKQADFVVLEGSSYLDLAYRMGSNPAWAVAKKGQVVAGPGAAP